MNIWSHARGITANLAAALCELEISSPIPNTPPDGANARKRRIEQAIADTWQAVVDEVETGRFELTASYLLTLHQRLAVPSGAEAPGIFHNQGRSEAWDTFIDEITVEYPAEGAWVLAQLYWGGHVHSMALSLGWLCVNALRLQQGMWAIYPPPETHPLLIEMLHDAGPDCWDAESLRALLPTYAASQEPL